MNGAAPSVVSINRSSPSTTTAPDGSVTYTVIFSEPVTNVLPTDFVVVTNPNLTANATVAVSPNTGTSDTFAVTISSVAGYGTLGLNLVNSGITDASGDPLANGPTPFVGQTYSIQNAINLTGPTFYVERDTATPLNLDIWTNATAAGAPVVSEPFSSIISITLSANTAGDSFTSDFSNGTVVPAGGLTFNGFGSTAGNSLTVVGTGTDTAFGAAAGIFKLNTNAVDYSSSTIGNVYFAPFGSTESLAVASGNVTLAPGTSSGITTDSFSSINIAAGAKLTVPQAATHGTRMLIKTAGLALAGSSSSWTAALDLTNNDLDVANGSLAALNSQVAQGLATGINGIFSSTASSDPSYLTTLGAIQNSIDGSAAGAPLFGAAATQGLFDGANPASTDVLIKYTYYGDVNLDGQVDGTDYSRIDAAYGTPASGWFNGDFNYDSSIDGTDYTLIDNAFNQQGASLAAEVATPAVQIGISGKLTGTAAKATSIFAEASSAVATWQQEQAAEPTSIALAIFNSDDSPLHGKFSESAILLG